MVGRHIEQMRGLIDGSVGKPALAALLAFELTRVEPGIAVFEIEADERHANPMGTVHGGILATIADSAMGMAYVSELEDDETFTTLELKLNFLRPVRS